MTAKEPEAMSSESGTPSVTECAKFVSAQLRIHMPAGTYAPYADRIDALIAENAALREKLALAENARDSHAVKVGEYYIGRHPAGGYWIEHESGAGMQGGRHLEEVIDDYYKRNF